MLKRFYFDHNAGTPLTPEAAQVFAETLQLAGGNPSSIHQEGQQARQVMEAARRGIALFLGATAPEIVFTSGGTEADNLAVLGLVRNVPVTKKHVLTSIIEHPAVLETCRQLEREGVAVTYLPVDHNGLIDSEEIQRQLRPETVLVSVMHANNEVGTIQPLKQIAAIVQAARKNGQPVYFHSDGVQAPGRIPVNMMDLGVDLYSVSAHKLYGPKGIGALFARKGVPLKGVQFGGKHERERRAGTENPAGAAAFRKGWELAQNEAGFIQLAEMRNCFENRMLNELSGVEVNGSVSARLPNTSNLFFNGVEGEALVISLDLKGFAVSTGAACSSGAVEPSHVLLAMGRSREQARRCVRFSFGLTNTIEEADKLAGAVIASVQQLRATARKTQPTPGIYVHA